MRATFIQIGGIAGLLAFVNNLWNHSSVERTVFVSLAVGISIYFVLLIGEHIIQRILNKPAPQEPEDAKVKEETINGPQATRPAEA